MNTKLLQGVSVVLFLLFVTAGILLMAKSERIYQESLNQSNRMIDVLIQNKAPLVLPPSYASVKDGYGQALTFFMLAFGIFLFIVLLPRLQNLSIGPGGVTLTLREVQQTVETLVKQNNSLQAESTGIGGGKQNVAISSLQEDKGRQKELAENNHDPQKGKWGGEAEHNLRRMSATVTHTQWPGYYLVRIVVESTNPQLPLTGIVKFHLHNTFRNADPVIAVTNNKAILELPKVYGAFTIGAEADNGDTFLELDLATVKDVPAGFLDN